MCTCMCVYESDPGPSVLSAVGAVLHISHMTAPNLALPDCTVLISHRTREHNAQQSTLCSYGWTSVSNVHACVCVYTHTIITNALNV